MPHVALVPFTGFRICRPELRELGFTLPGLRQRGAALGDLPALGLLTLAGMLPEGWTCSYHPAAGESNDASAEQLAEQIIHDGPALVALSALTASAPDAYRFSARLRAAGLRVVMGGLHVTTCPDEATQHCDAVVVGDGEPCWADILADAAAGALRPIYRAADFRHKRRATSWPLPRFELLGDSIPRFTLQTERGCPLACDFCAASRLLGPFREKPLENIASELAAICRRSPRPLLELADDNTFAGKRDTAALCAVLGQSGARWFTECDWRIGERPELLGQMAAAGCVQVLVGIESLVFRYPGMGAKQDALDRVLRAVAAIQDAGIAVNGCFILGADGETRASIDRLIAFVLESPLADVQLTLQTPFPGTALRSRLAREGRLLADRDWSHCTLLDVTFQPDRLSVAELERAFLDAIQQVYAAGATQRRNAIRREVWRRSAVFSKAGQ